MVVLPSSTSVTRETASEVTSPTTDTASLTTVREHNEDVSFEHTLIY